jgi:hypothetical protein
MLRDVRLVRLLLVIAVGCGAAACDNGDIIVDPTPPIVTETFTGTVNRNGLQQHTFVATARGTVKATIAAIEPSSSPVVGFSMGTWDGAVCTAVMTNRFATTSSSLSGAVVGITSLCVQIFDASGEVPEDAPVSYTITVERP